MKKITLLILLSSSHLAFANIVTSEPYEPKPMIEGSRRVDELMEWNKNHPGEMPPLTEQEKYEFFTKKGMPVPGSGATVVDVKGFKMTPFQSTSINKFNSDQRTNGYHDEKSVTAKLLLTMPEIAEKEYNVRKSVAFNPNDTHLYEIMSTMQMGYAYKGIPSQLAVKVIGYAPESIFVNNGWAAAVEFFIPSFGGVCAYHEKSIALTKTAAYVPQEIATYMVNNKLTTMNTVGNKASGFVYEVEWWDKDFNRMLECASKDYSPAIVKETIELAKKIDR